MSGPRCRLCASDRLNAVLTLPRAPRNIQRLLRREQLADDRSMTLVVRACEACGLVQLDQSPGRHYYDDYVMTVSHSPQMRRYQQEQAGALVGRYGLRGRTVVEFGCGDGHFLGCLRQAGAIPVGVEPSRPFAALARERGFAIHGCYVEPGLSLPGSPFDAFAARQVLEHVTDVAGFLAGVRASLTAGAVGLVEVPSLEQTIERERFYDFFADHVNYFTAETLEALLRRFGFDCLRVERGMNGEFLVAEVRCGGAAGVQRGAAESSMAGLSGGGLQASMQRLIGELRAYVGSHVQAGRKVGVWGAGGKGIAVLAAAELNGIALLVDSDPHKQGAYTPVSHLLVRSPEVLLSEPPDALVLTALAYREEIIRELRGRLRYRGEIAVLGRRLEVERGEGGAGRRGAAVGRSADVADVVELARRIRAHVLRMTHGAGASHVGSCLSIADLLAVLYGRVLRVDPSNPADESRDRFVLSKGHAAAALYVVLAERGFFPVEWLGSYCGDGAALAGHVKHAGVPGVEASTGSLGHGLGLAVGMALAARRGGRAARAVALLSDGECDEGAVWEAALLAAHHRLDNLTAIIDCNGIQSFGTVEEVLKLEPLAEKWRAFGWGVREIDGHEPAAILAACAALPLEGGRPSCIVARTRKGCGISFMENRLEWHYRAPDASQLRLALEEIGAR
ncbi:MAG: hypothetical protein CHACPFDD_03038 [Phycisphaerae bacterium]|nr:hypothetical protein [Phycisphaerae bacterium]